MLMLVGDFAPKETLAMVDQYLGKRAEGREAHAARHPEGAAAEGNSGTR